jgi:hypothetical protein
MKMGQVRWYKKVDPTQIYCVALDPSLGTGGDYAAIQIIEVPSFKQVGEWNHNTTPIQSQVRILREICKFIDAECMNYENRGQVYYSVENNTVGEAAIVAINEMGEESIPGMFMSEPIKKGHVRRFRRGFNTTNVSKISACAKLKQLVEQKKLKISSKALISELKTYIAKGISFEAKVNETDDLVASLLLALRMIGMLGDWDSAIYDRIVEDRPLDDADLPMPIFVNHF